MPDHLAPPHGGSLVNLVVDPVRAAELRAASQAWPSWTLTPRQRCDLELLVSGGLSPLTGFLGRADYQAVCSSMRLADGTLWPLPVTLDVTSELAAGLTPGAMLALRDPEGVMLAALSVEERYQPDRGAEAEVLYATTDRRHPGVADLLDRSYPVYLAGPLEAVGVGSHYDHRRLRLTPGQLREHLDRTGVHRVVAYHTRRPMHRAQAELAFGAARRLGAHLLVHPAAGPDRPGDVDLPTRVRCYQALLGTRPDAAATLALVPLATRLAGPREAVWDAIIRQNHGATHFVVGPDHAGPDPHPDGLRFCQPYDAQQLVAAWQPELGIELVASRLLVSVADASRRPPAAQPAAGGGRYLPDDQVPAGARTRAISDRDLRRRLEVGADIPEWFTPPAVAAELRHRYPPRSRQGVTVFFSGLSGSGKSTIANVLLARFQEWGGRPVTLLDGDVVRQNLSSELGFSKEHRDLNIRRIGFVASEITKNGGIAICAPIAPYERVRAEVRSLIEPLGGFVLVHVATPLEVCEGRDRKGLYAKARAGLIQQFTGITDPFEPPSHAEVTIDTTWLDPEQAADTVIAHLRREGYLPGDASAAETVSRPAEGPR